MALEPKLPITINYLASMIEAGDFAEALRAAHYHAKTEQRRELRSIAWQEHLDALPPMKQIELAENEALLEAEKAPFYRVYDAIVSEAADDEIEALRGKISQVIAEFDVAIKKALEPYEPEKADALIAMIEHAYMQRELFGNHNTNDTATPDRFANYAERKFGAITVTGIENSGLMRASELSQSALRAYYYAAYRATDDNGPCVNRNAVATFAFDALSGFVASWRTCDYAAAPMIKEIAEAYRKGKRAIDDQKAAEARRKREAEEAKRKIDIAKTIERKLAAARAKLAAM